MRHIMTSQFPGVANEQFDLKVCNAVFGVLGRPFDIDLAYGLMTPEGNFWYEIHPEHDEFNPIEPDGQNDEAKRVLEGLKPLFAQVGCASADPSLGQELYLGHNWLRVVTL